MSESEISVEDLALVGVKPEGWKVTALANVASLSFGQSPPSSTYNFVGDGLPFFQGKTEFGTRHPTVRQWCTEPTRVAEAGDILLSVRAPVGPTNVAPFRCGIGRGLASIRAQPGLDSDYLLHYLRYIAAKLASKGVGTTFSAITKPVVQAIEVPIAPHSLQLRIVQKIDELFSGIDEGERALERVRKLVEQYRPSVLKAAVTGELTREWREQHAGELESGEVLLTRILEARRQAWETTELVKMATRKQRPANDAWKRKYKEPGAPDSASLEELPSGWIWASVEQLSTTVVDGVHKKPSYVSHGIPFVTVRILRLAQASASRS